MHTPRTFYCHESHLRCSPRWLPIAPFAHREALPSCPAMGEFSCKHEIRLQGHSRRLRNSLPRHSQKRIFDARRAGFAIAPFAHRVALPSCPASDEFSCKHEIRPSRPGRLRNSLPRHSQKRIFDAFRAGCAIAPFAHREALLSCPASDEFSCKHEIRPSQDTSKLCKNVLTKDPSLWYSRKAR